MRWARHLTTPLLLCISLGLGLGLGGVAPELSAQEPEYSGPPLMRLVERPDEQLLILALRLNHFTLTEALIGYQTDERLLLPLAALTEALEFSIAVDPDGGTANGWFLREERTFELDLVAGEVVSDGKRFRLEPGQVERHYDDIYFAVELLSQWFPVAMQFKFSDLVVEIVSLEPLPIEDRIERQRRRDRLRVKRDKPRYERVEAPTAWFSWPFVDTSVELSLHRTGDFEDYRGRFSSTASGIVAGLDAEVTANGDTDEQAPNLRVRLGRTEPSGGLLGPVDAREFALGDVATQSIPLVAQNTIGRGADVSTFGLGRLAEPTRITLRGELPVGWEAEVYRNGELLDFQTDSDDGRYEFDDLETVPGLNVFRVVLYGPQGQQREVVERFFITPSTLDPGETAFRLTVNQQNQDLINTRDSRTDDPDDGEMRLVFDAEHALYHSLSVAGSLSSLPIEGERLNYLQAGLRAAPLGVLTRLDGAVADDGGFAVGLSAQTQLDGFSIFAEHNQFMDFRSDRTEDEDVSQPLRSRSTLRLNGAVPLPGLGRLPMTARATHKLGDDGDFLIDLFGRLSAQVATFSVSAEGNAKIRDDRDAQVEGTLRIGTLLGDVRLRGEVNYDFMPLVDFKSAILTADWNLGRNFGARFGIRHRQASENVTTLTAGVNRRFENFDLGANVDVDDNGDVSAVLGITFGLGRNPRTGKVDVYGRNIARRGAIAPRVFLDRDGDGTLGEGDEPLADVGFSGRQVDRAVLTDADGHALLTGVEPFRGLDLSIDERTLEDPFWLPRKPGFNVMTRPGAVTEVDFAVVETGEIDGTLLIDRGERRPPASGVRVQLLDERNGLVRTVISAFDGFYLIDRVPLGRYVLRLDPTQIEELGYQPMADRSVALDSQEPILYGEDFLLRPPARPRQSAAAFRVQLGADRSEPQARETWRALRTAHPDLLSSMTLFVHPVELRDRGTWYRVQGGPLKEDTAQSLCARLRSRGVACLVPGAVETIRSGRGARRPGRVESGA